MESFKLELHPDNQIHIALFQNVSNASELKQRFINQDQTLACCLINAKLVIGQTA
jgi:EKC/KEOPS complex subunit CGI121/TPRKB